MRHRSTLQLLDGDKPSDGSQYPAHSGYRLRYRFECGMCGDVKVERGENCSTSSTGYATRAQIMTRM